MNLRVALAISTLICTAQALAAQTLEERVVWLEGQVAELWQALEEERGGDWLVPAELVGNEHLRWGFPGGSCTILSNDYFVTCHDGANRIPSWVTYRLTADDVFGDADRTDDFRADAELHESERAELADYEGSGYDRGHMAPAATFRRSDEAMSQTFVLSNMAPQAPALNRQMWRMLEEDVRELASRSANIWVFTGSLFLDDNGLLVEPTTFIGENSVAVPTHFYKAVLVDSPAPPASPITVFAFVMPNQHQQLDGAPKDYLVSIDLLEALSGLDFFSALPDSIESVLEQQTTDSWPTS